jgi:hypothetical protein
MKLRKIFGIESFDLILSIVVVFSVTGFLFSIYISSFILGIITAIIFSIFSMVLSGRVVAPYYLDAHAIHLLRLHKGKIEKDILYNYYHEEGGLEDTIKRLSNKGYVRIYENSVVLKEQYSSGKLNSFLSNWAMKSILKRARKNKQS